jgi:hypothetical protein
MIYMKENRDKAIRAINVLVGDRLEAACADVRCAEQCVDPQAILGGMMSTRNELAKTLDMMDGAIKGLR